MRAGPSTRPAEAAGHLYRLSPRSLATLPRHLKINRHTFLLEIAVSYTKQRPDQNLIATKTTFSPPCQIAFSSHPLALPALTQEGRAPKCGSRMGAPPLRVPSLHLGFPTPHTLKPTPSQINRNISRFPPARPRAVFHSFHRPSSAGALEISPARAYHGASFSCPTKTGNFMAHPIPIHAAVAAKRIGLDVWMDRVIEQADRVREGWGADDVHDLRVALRRCRTMADALSEVNPGSGWRKMKKASRDLFDSLGELRDVQVEREWLKRLGAASDPVRKHLLRVLARQEKKCRGDAEHALEKFDRKDWRKWSRKLPAKAQFFPVESVVFQRQALVKLNEAVELYQLARKSRSRVAWHRLRIGLKHFRYIVENFLPQRYEVWAGDLKRMQDLLGEVHDLDVLRAEIRHHAATLDPAIVAQWLEKIESERKTRLDEFRAKTADKESLWLVWRAGFQWGHALHAADSADRQIA